MDLIFFEQIKNRTVRDLYWLIFEPSPLLRMPVAFDLPLFPSELYEEWKMKSYDYFEKLEHAPKQLNQFVDRPKNKRLGFYCESLFSFFLQTFPGIELWAQNIQIIEAKQTLGEIDFIFTWQDKVFHVELAVKYYLLLPGLSAMSASNWIGPSRKDNLYKKLSKVQERQLSLGKHVSITKRLPSSFEDRIDSFLLLKGNFFQRPSAESRCDFLNKTPNFYFFEKEMIGETVNFLDRPNWMSSFYDSYQTAWGIEINSIEKPAMIKRQDGSTAFLVPDNWND